MNFIKNFKNIFNILGRKFFLIGRKRGFSLVPWYSKKPSRKENIVSGHRVKFIFDFRNRKFYKYPIRNKIDERVVNQVFVAHDYDFFRLKRGGELRRMYYDSVASGYLPLIIDCGANIGGSCFYFAHEFPDAKIVGVEPDSENLVIARRVNEDHENVSFVNAAIGSSNGYCQIHDPGLGPDAYRTVVSDDGNVRVVTINDLVNGICDEKHRPFICKIDIEGSENELFSSNYEWIDVFPILIIELHDWMLPAEGNSNNFLKAISKYNRDFIYIGENIWSIKNDL